MRLLRYLWASPTTLIGLAVVALARCTGGRSTVVDGVIECHGGAATFACRRLSPLPNGAAAVTLGHVVIGRDPAALESTRGHERVHVRQCERWGPLFVPAYFAASLVAWLRGDDAYRGNRFEREAFGLEGHSSEASEN